MIAASAKHGLQSDGVELNPWLVWWSRISAFREGVGPQTKFFCRDLWKFDIKPYDYLVIFGVEQMVSKEILSNQKKTFLQLRRVKR